MFSSLGFRVCFRVLLARIRVKASKTGVWCQGGKASPLNWVAVEELKLCYHNGHMQQLIWFPQCCRNLK